MLWVVEISLSLGRKEVTGLWINIASRLNVKLKRDCRLKKIEDV